MRPTPRLLLSHPAHFLSLGFGAGLSPWAPGTAGTLLAWALYPLLRTPLSEFVFFAMLVSFFLAGVLATERTGQALGVADHGAIVWDEIIAFWLVLLLVPQTVGAQAAAFLLFRVFDVWKPTPIREAEQRWQTPLA